jgi:hypothetical protein
VLVSWLLDHHHGDDDDSAFSFSRDVCPEETILLAGFGNRIPPGDLTMMFVVHPAGRTNSAIAELNSAIAEFQFCYSRIRSTEFCYSRIRIVVVAGRRESRYIESCKEIFYTYILRCDVTIQFFIFTERSRMSWREVGTARMKGTLREFGTALCQI